MTDAERAVWLAERRNGVGGSDVAAIMGLSPWASPYSVWADKTGLVVDDDGDSPAMSFGRRAEAMIAPWFHELTGLTVGNEQQSCQHPVWAYRRCTIDGMVYDGPPSTPDDAVGVYEAKTTSAPPTEWEASIPVHYQCQAQWTMHVTGHHRLWFAVLHLAFGRPDLRVYELGRDDNDIDLIVKTVDAFWFNNVMAGIPPATDDHPATTRATKNLPALGGALEADDQLADTVARWREYKAGVKLIDQQIAGLENEIRAAMGEHTEAVYNGDLLVSHRTQSRPEHVVKASTFRVLRNHSKGE